MHLWSIDSLCHSILWISPYFGTGFISDQTNCLPVRSIDQVELIRSYTLCWITPRFSISLKCNQWLPPTDRRLKNGSSIAFVGQFIALFSRSFYVFILDTFRAKKNENMLKLLQKGFRHTQHLSKIYWKHRETMVHQHPQLKFIVCPEVMHYDAKLHL